MSTPTEHLGLHQWEAGDSFLRSDFNQDFAKIDAGVGALQQWASTACVAGSVLITDSKADINVDLGFRPKLVIFGMYGEEYRFFKVCAEDLNFTCFARGSGSSVSASGQTNYLTDTGFHFSQPSWFTTEDENKTKIHYVAFR